jgi:Fic-DOC domain mobile mystery protein B
MKKRESLRYGELDEFEQLNIEKATLWTLKRNFKTDSLLTEVFVKELHRRMYGDVWSWAGAFRKTNKNIGVDKLQIAVELKTLLDDCSYWIKNHVYDADETVVRFKHRLVSIHCFSNGNGRHSRLFADVLIEQVFNNPVFSWGAASVSKKGEARKIYLQALKKADVGSFEELIAFARS